eukprot:CAMPEP_0116881856 /NCGR_PEP_ID=MMETSP0463-20121206/13915_1 /TAXON_ID=181622 /ORGANISM="Strombidinopsis sp, Strain SopsisLIS2011" /LENGTH=66 /DNA_ID=CAMNT_0004534113 /DNA_START=1223 /DNA_END=1423 /DNA_ORIENTATION=-
MNRDIDAVDPDHTCMPIERLDLDQEHQVMNQLISELWSNRQEDKISAHMLKNLFGKENLNRPSDSL